MLFWRGRGLKNPKETMDRVKDEPPLELEKGDVWAIILAAIITFLPVLIIFIGWVLLIYWLFVGRF